MKWMSKLLLLVFLMAGFAGCSSVKSDQNQVEVSFVEAVDGDTIKVIYNGKKETVRYLLVDTPEEKKPNTCVQPYSIEAYKRNQELLKSGNVTLEFEHGSKRDKYGRLLAYVFVDDVSVQETLLKEGFARVAYIYEPPYTYLEQYQADERLAKKEKLNIWSKSGYATERGFNGCVDQDSTPAFKESDSADNASPKGSNGSEIFANCTELRKKYPDGVPKGHPAYQDKMDRDQDGYACEN